MSAWDPELDVQLTDSEDEENIAMKRDFHGREALLFVVDANLSAEMELFKEALKIIRGAYISGLLTNDKDLMGLVFANTKHSPLPFASSAVENIVVPANCAVFLPPRQLTKAIVEHFLQFLMTVEDSFESDYGIAGNGGCGSFANMLRLSIELLEKCGYKLNNAKIIYMTDRDTPHSPQSNDFQVALQKANDLEGKEIEFHVIPMVDEFNYDVFYKEFLMLSRAIESDAFQVPDAQLLREILEDRKLKQDFLRRCLGHFTLSLGPNLTMSAQYYNYFKNKAYPKKVKILRKTNAIVQQKRAIMVRQQDEETMEFTREEQVLQTGGWHEINLGDMAIRITTEQLNRVRNLHVPGMMLLGFKHKSSLPEVFYTKPSNFMYPDDQSIIGSKRLFRALWQRCMEREKIAICLFMCKRKSIPRYVALMPVEGQSYDNNESQSNTNYRSLLTGDGFKIIYLPAAKHIRNNNLSDWNAIENTAPAEGVELFQKIIRKLRVDYKPNLINDPNLQTLQSNLLALALDVQTESDGLSQMPDTDEQDKRIEPFMDEFERIFGNDVEAATKRGARNPAQGASEPKMPKVDEEAIKRFDFVEELIKAKRLPGCTAVQLRFILDEHFGVKLPKTATKAVIIERIEALNK